MFAPLSEYLENKLGDAFCKEYQVYGTYDRPHDWEEYKESFAMYMIEQFSKNNKNGPNTYWDDDR